MKLSSTLHKYWLGVLIAALAFLASGNTADAGKPSQRQRQQPSGSAASTVTGAYPWRPDLDPQVAWSNYSLNVIYDTYIPLLTYRHAGGKAGSEVILVSP